ncbi:MAG TPA: hypothetical protein PKA27_03740 [Fimbriimonadaceae bacterium]|nr:hypothetical protein [Fimbriimonadaceae bacterium]
MRISACFAAILLASLIIGGATVTAGQTPAVSLVRLQMVSPGIAQNGHVNLTGKVLAGGLSVFDSSNSGIRLTSSSLAFADATTEDIIYTYSSVAQQHSFAVNGSQKLIISNNGIAGPGSGITSLNASSLATGTVNDARLSSNVPKLNANNVFSGNIGVGVDPGASRLRVNGNLHATSLSIESETRYVTLHPADFERTSTGNITTTEDFVSSASVVTPAQAIAPLHLPQGAVIGEVRAYVLDIDGNEDARLEIWANRIDNTNRTNVTLMPISANSAQIVFESRFASYTVNNVLFSYYVRVDLPASSQVKLRAVRVAYVISQPLP